MKTGKIDAISSISSNLSNNTSTEPLESIKSSIPAIRNVNTQHLLKIVSLSLMSFKLFEWNNITFKLHGFFIMMLLIDLFWNIFSIQFYLWIPFSLFVNVILFLTILLCAYTRIKIFKSRSTSTADDIDDDLVTERLLNNNNIDINGNNKSDNISFKSVTISYLGALVELTDKFINIEINIKQIRYYLFPLLFHAIFCVIWFCFSLMFDELNHKFKYNICNWSRNANLYCMLMCLLPVPGFDGGALLSIYLKKHKWSKIVITLTLILTSAFVIAVCGIYFVSSFCTNIFLLYLMVIIAVKLFEFVFNPKDDNLKALKSMAVSSKNLSDVAGNMV